MIVTARDLTSGAILKYECDGVVGYSMPEVPEDYYRLVKTQDGKPDGEVLSYVAFIPRTMVIEFDEPEDVKFLGLDAVVELQQRILEMDREIVAEQKKQDEENAS